MTHLMLCQIGPVQSFIAAGRRTSDLYVGSKLLSSLAGAGVAAAQQAGATLLFPAPLPNGTLPAGVPHRFAFITDADPHALAVPIREAIDRRWREVYGAVRGWMEQHRLGNRWQAAFDRQIGSWLEFYWVAVAYKAGAHGKAYTDAVRALASRKNARHFPQIEEPGVKCTLTAAASALDLDWDALRRALYDDDAILIRTNEQLGALALVKRIAPRVAPAALGFDAAHFPATDEIAGLPDEDRAASRGKRVEGYLAILHMDGDRVGERLSSMQTAEEHIHFSQQLARFADETVPAIIAQFPRAALVYAGGDDVLALLPLRAAFACADAIRAAFTDALLGVIDQPTMSAGIAVVASHSPLDIGLESAREAEHRAKHGYGRNAVVVIETHGSQQRVAGAQWEQDGEPLAWLLDDLQAAFTQPGAWLSSSIGYDLTSIAYALTGAHMPAAARQAELERLLKRRTLEGSSAAKASELAPRLIAWGEAKPSGWDDVANWAILARFLAERSEGREQ